MKGFTVCGLAQALGIPHEHVKDAIDELVQAGMIKPVGDGRWLLTEAGRCAISDGSMRRPDDL